MGTQLLCDVLGRDRRFSPIAGHSLEQVTSVAPDVGLVSLTAELDSFKGAGLIQELRRRRPHLPVIALTEESNRAAVVQALRAGARGVLCRAEPIATLGKCITCVSNGQVWANQTELDFLLQALTDPIPIRVVDAKGMTLLSAREQDVVRWVTEGLTNREIADRLDLSEHTIKNYLFRIFEKLGISNRMELMLYIMNQLAPRVAKAPAAESLSSNGADGGERQETSTPVGAFALGQRYKHGEGVPVDNVLAYMWFDIAEAAASEIMSNARLALRQLAQSMTLEQIAEAKRRSAEWLARNNALGRGERSESRPLLESPPFAA